MNKKWILILLFMGTFSTRAEIILMGKVKNFNLWIPLHPSASLKYQPTKSEYNYQLRHFNNSIAMSLYRRYKINSFFHISPFRNEPPLHLSKIIMIEKMVQQKPKKSYSNRNIQKE